MIVGLVYLLHLMIPLIGLKHVVVRKVYSKIITRLLCVMEGNVLLISYTNRIQPYKFLVYCYYINRELICR
jgi:hypothetical protein